jgi:hypothetical protein
MSPKDTLATSLAERQLQDRVMHRISQALLEFAPVGAQENTQTQVQASGWDPKHVAAVARFLLLRARSSGGGGVGSWGGGGEGGSVMGLVQVVGSQTAALLELSQSGGGTQTGAFSLQQLGTIAVCLTSSCHDYADAVNDERGEGGEVSKMVLANIGRAALAMLGGGQDGNDGVGGGGWVVVVEEDVESVAAMITALAKAGLLPPASPLRKVRARTHTHTQTQTQGCLLLHRPYARHANTFV